MRCSGEDGEGAVQEEELKHFSLTDFFFVLSPGAMQGKARLSNNLMRPVYPRVSHLSLTLRVQEEEEEGLVSVV